MPRRALASLVLLAAAACGDDGVDQPVQPRIDILPAAAGISVNAGTSGTLNVTVTRDGGFTGDVTLSVEATPAGVTGRFDPATLPNGTTTSVLTLTVVAAATDGTTPITVRARGTGVADKTATIQLTVTRPTPTTGAITWKFCDPVIRTVWLAAQDGTAGAWKQVIPSADGYHFDITQAKGAVAWTREIVTDNFVTEVFYGTPDELSAFGALDCLVHPAGTRTLTGTVTGFTPPTGLSGDLVTIGTTGAATPVVSGTTFQLFGVPDGPHDFIASRVSHTFGNGLFNDTLTKLIVRRGVNAAASLAPFDFNGPEAVAPTVADLALDGTNGEPTRLLMSYITEPNAPPGLATLLYSADLGLATRAPLYTVPFPLQKDDDLHVLSLFTGPAPNFGEPNVSGRRLTRYFSAPENQTLTLGSPLAIPVSTPVAGSPSRFRVQAPVQAEYDHFYVAEWIQLPDLAPTRAVAMIITSAYAGGAAWDATVPDLTPAGWDQSWGLRAGIETGTFFSAEGSSFPTTVPSGATNHGIVRSASRTSLPTGANASAVRRAIPELAREPNPR